MIELPNLPLIMERHCRNVAENIDPNYIANQDDLEVNVFYFPEQDEGLVVGPAQYISAVMDWDKQIASVFSGNSLRYSITNPSVAFYQDLKEEALQPLPALKYFQ